MDSVGAGRLSLSCVPPRVRASSDGARACCGARTTSCSSPRVQGCPWSQRCSAQYLARFRIDSQTQCFNAKVAIYWNDVHEEVSTAFVHDNSRAIRRIETVSKRLLYRLIVSLHFNHVRNCDVSDRIGTRFVRNVSASIVTQATRREAKNNA